MLSVCTIMVANGELYELLSLDSCETGACRVGLLAAEAGTAFGVYRDESGAFPAKLRALETRQYQRKCRFLSEEERNRNAVTITTCIILPRRSRVSTRLRSCDTS